MYTSTCFIIFFRYLLNHWQFHWHMTDNEGFNVQWDYDSMRLTLAGNNGGYYTPANIQSVVSFASTLGVAFLDVWLSCLKNYMSSVSNLKNIVFNFFSSILNFRVITMFCQALRLFRNLNYPVTFFAGIWLILTWCCHQLPLRTNLIFRTRLLRPYCMRSTKKCCLSLVIFACTQHTMKHRIRQ